ncbi:hypothetical protein C2E23DRAFT_570851 [Lenzites betulinus]|nr:hypothetical protein C2E23DRAFT_570851 [Lenzites betulinus]
MGRDLIIVVVLTAYPGAALALVLGAPAGVFPRDAHRNSDLPGAAVLRRAPPCRCISFPSSLLLPTYIDARNDTDGVLCTHQCTFTGPGVLVPSLIVSSSSAVLNRVSYGLSQACILGLNNA